MHVIKTKYSTFNANLRSCFSTITSSVLSDSGQKDGRVKPGNLLTKRCSLLLRKQKLSHTFWWLCLCIYSYHPSKLFRVHTPTGPKMLLRWIAEPLKRMKKLIVLTVFLEHKDCPSKNLHVAGAFLIIWHLSTGKEMPCFYVSVTTMFTKSCHLKSILSKLSTFHMLKICSY